MKLRRAFADANKIVRRSMDFRYIGELTGPFPDSEREGLGTELRKPSHFGM